MSARILSGTITNAVKTYDLWLNPGLQFGIFIPQNADFKIISIFCCIDRVNIDRDDKTEVF
jgi:hypothetical protein